MTLLPGKYRNDIETLSHKIWDLAEVEFETLQSSRACVELLERENFKIEQGLGQVTHSFRAVWGHEGPRVAILVEVDALRDMSQKSGITFQEVNPWQENGHACGHNLLGSAAILAALKLRDTLLEKNLKCQIEVYGCPAEESGYGKAIMADNGVFDGVDFAIAWHPNTINGLWCDETLAVRIYEVTFKGKSAHAAGAPETGYSALDACELLNVGMNYYREHTPDGTRIHYAYVNAGGKAANVVQGETTISYYLRSFSNEVLNTMESRFKDMVKGASLMSHTRYEIVEKSQCKGFKPNTVLANTLYEVMESYGPLDYSDEAKVWAKSLSVIEGKEIETKLEKKSIGNKSMVSTDVGDISHIMPTAQFFLACEPMGTPMHSWQWTANGKSEYAFEGIEHASEIIKDFVVKVVESPTLLLQAQDEFGGSGDGL